MLGKGKDRIDRLHDVGRRAEGGVQADRLEALLGLRDAPAQPAALLAEDRGCGTLETVDRLLLVADREDRGRPRICFLYTSRCV